MNETRLVPKIIGRLGLDPGCTRALLAFCGALEEFRLSPGLVLWAWDLLGVTQLTASEKLIGMSHLLALFVAQSRGHTTLDPGGPELAELARLVREATGDDRFTHRLIGTEFVRFLENGTLASLVGSREEAPAAGVPWKPVWVAPLSLQEGSLQFARTRWMERECARLLRDRFQTAGPPEEEMDPFSGFQGELDDDQKTMIRRIRGRRVFWISGGPGTGKTSCIYGLLWALGRWYPGLKSDRIAIAAPTGKAGFRISQSLRRMAHGGGPFDEAILDGRLDARTLHRLLEYRPDADRFGRHEGWPLEVDWVIVDESSMVDLVLCHALLRALPERAGLIWIGDRDQLPAVGLGAVFQVAWDRGPDRHPEHFFRLTRNYRSEQGLARGIARVMERADLTWEGPTDAFPAADRLVLHPIETARQWQDFLECLYRQTYDRSYWDLALQRFEWDPSQVACGPGEHPRAEEISRILRQAGGSPVLCVTHAGSRGTVAVNELFHRRHPWGFSGLLPGEPVMIQANDYQRNLWNGDFGVVLNAFWNGKETPVVAFLQGEQLRIFPMAGLALSRAYAFSVHKSQGSEFGEVTLVLPEVFGPMVTRELIYTAITRGRRCVRVAGTPAILQGGLSNVVERRMNLDRWLFGETSNA